MAVEERELDKYATQVGQVPVPRVQLMVKSTLEGQ